VTDEDTQELIIVIDDVRSVTINPTKDGEGLVICLEDPHTVAVVEFKRPDVIALYEALEDWIKR
jgi:hypothetical protein